MGRKIPAKKHRGVKDPLLQQARRLQSVKHKINAPPRDPDEQPVPRSLTLLFQRAERPAPAAPRSRRPKRPPLAAEGRGGGGGGGGCGGGGGAGAVARLRRLPGEAARAFGQRISGAMRALHNHAPQGYPGEYDSDAEGSEEDAKGARMAWQRQRRAKRTARRAAAAGAAGAVGAVGAGGGVGAAGRRGAAASLTRQQRRRLRLKEKKADKESEVRAPAELVYERVPFGAEPRAPPALRPPRRAPPPRPAGARGLALKQTLAAAEAERARQQAVAAYRALRRRSARAAPSPALTAPRPH